MAEYLPYCEVVDLTEKCPSLCRDAYDQQFLDLAQSSGADLLVSGDQDLLVLAGLTTFTIESPEAYRQRVAS
jgi:predicted nucleic acid-binding protein